VWSVPWQFCFQWCVGGGNYYNEISCAAETVKFCCDCVSVEDRVSEVKGY